MSSTLPRVDGPADAELISAVRGGDIDAYGELFARHSSAATRLARQLVSSGDADDLVSEAFAKVLTVLQRGGGPDVAFRAYLLTAVRRLHVDRIRATSRLQTTDDLAPFDPGVPFQDTAVAGFENEAAAKAFASLPERWQLVLWHLEVEGQKPADIAPLLEGDDQIEVVIHASDGSKWEYGIPFSRATGRYLFEEIDVLANDFGDTFAEELKDKIDALVATLKR